MKTNFKKSFVHLCKYGTFILLFLAGFNNLVSAFDGGTGTAGDPYRISTATHLNNVRNFLTAHFIIVNDINLNENPYNTGSGWDPIGTSGAKFQGTFDGNNKIISNLFISRSGTSNIGLFGYTFNALIKNVWLENAAVTGWNGVGALVGYNDSSVITKCYTKGAVTGTGQVGGFVGYNNNFSNINNCFNIASVTANNDVGGFAGYNNNSSKIIDCFNRGNVITATNTFGNFLGFNQTSTASVVSNCYSTGSVPTSGSFRGAFAGYNNGTISNSFWNKETSGDMALGAINGGSGITSCSGLITSQMKSQNVFTDSGWNFTDTWIIDPEINDGYPYLRAFIAGTNWYVATNGNNANSGLSTGSPFLTITKALSVASPEDRIYIAAGTYAETVVIDTNSISLIGADSAVTIIDFGDSTVGTNANGIYAENKTGILIKNLQIKNVLNGIYFNNIDNSNIENVFINYTGRHGIYLINGSDNNSLLNNKSFNNLEHGFHLQNSQFNVLNNNISSSNIEHGFRLDAASNSNKIINNISSNNKIWGIQVISSHYNIITNNLITNNTSHGLANYHTTNNYFAQNTISSNDMYAVYIVGTSSADIFEKNNIITSPTNSDSAVYNSAGATFDFRYNYWNTTDSSQISAKIRVISGSVLWSPFRTSEIDTAVGADTVAPNTTTLAGCEASLEGWIKLNWTAVTTNELGSVLETGDTGLAGYHIFRAVDTQLISGDTPNWYAYLYDTVSAANTIYIDVNVNTGILYYYRVTAFDSHQGSGNLFYNESWFSNIQSITGLKIDTSVANNWYVDAVNGDTLNNGLSAATAKKYISQIAGGTFEGALLTAGDTIFVAAGTYNETVVISQNGISLIGADSSTTIIDPPGDSAVTTLYGIYALSKTNLRIADLRITDAYNGIFFTNVDFSVINNVTVDSCWGDIGINLENNSDSNLISNCYVNNSKSGIISKNSQNNYISNNVVNYCNNGINVFYGKNNYVLNNYSSHCALAGIYILSDTNIIMNNITNYNYYGIWNNSGINNLYENNIIEWNTNRAINQGAGNYITYHRNIIRYNNSAVMYFTSVNNLRVTNNLITNNNQSSNGVLQLSNTKYSYVANNEFDSNTFYAVYFSGSSSDNIVEKNNIKTSPSNPDSFVFNNCDTAFDLRYNYWTTTDSGIISNNIKGPYGNQILFAPFRTSEIDTTVGADTVAPAAPVFIDADTSVLKQVTLRWTKPTLDEDGTALSGLAGYRLYRVRSTMCDVRGDTDNWEVFLIFTTDNADDTDYIDTGFPATDTYYYRIVAYDSHIGHSASQFYNRSWYSQSFIVFAKYNTKPETPVLISPVNLPAPYTEYDTYGRTLNPRPNLIWYCPVDADSNNLHFLVYCDSGQGNILLANSSTDTRGFYYFKNGSYETFTLTGIDSTVYGNTIYFTPQINLNDSIYIWSVQAFDSDLYSDSASLRRFKIGGRIWTDTPLIAGQTLIRKIHIDELREEINFARKLRGLSAFSWTDPTITVSQTRIRKIHLDEMRNALNQTISAGLNSLGIWTQSTITAGETLIRKIDFDELRERLVR